MDALMWMFLPLFTAAGSALLEVDSGDVVDRDDGFLCHG